MWGMEERLSQPRRRSALGEGARGQRAGGTRWRDGLGFGISLRPSGRTGLGGAEAGKVVSSGAEAQVTVKMEKWEI